MVSFGACLTAGLALSYWFIYAFSFAQPSAVSWRAPIALSLIFIVPALLLISFLPESPRWLILQAREQEAISVLSALNEMPEDSEDVRREILQIKNAVIYMAKAPMTRVFSNGDYRYLHRTLLAIGLQIMQQFTGVNLFMQYLGGMFANQLHFDPRLSMLLAACSSTEFFLASFVAVIGIDRFWGRRTLTIFGSTGMCICMILLCALNWYGTAKKVTSAFYAMAAFLFLYNTCKCGPHSVLCVPDMLIVNSLLHWLARHELDVGRRVDPTQHPRTGERPQHGGKLALKFHRRAGYTCHFHYFDLSHLHPIRCLQLPHCTDNLLLLPGNRIAMP